MKQDSTGSRPKADAAAHFDPSVTVRVEHPADGGFVVADDGPGVPANDRDHVFESGYTTGKGTGLGLAIVKTIAEAHGWTVSVAESDAGGARLWSGPDDPRSPSQASSAMVSYTNTWHELPSSVRE